MTSRASSAASHKRRSGKSVDEENHKHLGWTFLTNHAHVLLCLYRHPDRRLRDIAAEVQITERMVQRIVAELVEAGYLKVIKEGRRNSYVTNSKLRLRHPMEMRHTIGELLRALN